MIYGPKNKLLKIFKKIQKIFVFVVDVPAKNLVLEYISYLMIFKNLLLFNSLTHEMQGGMKYGFLFIDLRKLAVGYDISRFS